MKAQRDRLRDIEAKQARSVVSEYGHVDSCDWETLGDSLTADVLTGATTLHVVDTCDLDEEPDGGHGWLLVDDTHLLRYTTCDGDPESADPTVTLLDPLPADVDEGAPVHLWDPRLEAVVTEMIAMVAIDGDDEGELVEATVAADLIDQLAAGPRDLNGESVRLEVEDHEWRIVDVEGGAGRAASGESTTVKGKNTDLFTLTAAGAQDLPLSHEPIPETEHVDWHPAGLGGVPQASDQWSRIGKTLTIPDVDGVLQAEDIISIEYLYQRQGASLSLSELPDFEATDWRYLIVVEGDSADRSAVDFDDSSWATGQAALGYPIVSPGSTGWPAPNTSTGSKDVGFWMRRDVLVLGGGTVEVTARVDGNWWLYWDGDLIGSNAAAVGVATVGPFVVPTTSGSHVLALHIDDDADDPSGDHIYGDVQVVIT